MKVEIYFKRGEIRIGLSVIEAILSDHFDLEGEFKPQSSGFVFERENGSRGGGSPFLYIRKYQDEGITRYYWSDHGWLQEDLDEGDKAICSRCGKSFVTPYKGYSGYCSDCVGKTAKTE